jgi:carbon-monoxide dehydrogenase medium subunit
VKPQSFAYRAPATLEEALALLAEHGDEAKVLAGGQSLVPLLNLRLARPGVLVDINRLPGLAAVERGPAGVRLGALVRHRALEPAGAVDGPLGRLLARAARHVGHPPIRTRGTVCGSLAHADPAAEWCLVALAAGAEVDVVSAGGARTLGVDELLDAALVTTLRPDELIVGVRFPYLVDGLVGTGFAERARTAGAFADLAACAIVQTVADAVDRASLAVAGTGGRPVSLAATARSLEGQPLTRTTVEAAAGSAAREAGVDGYVGAALTVLVADVLARAFEEVAPGWTSN